MMDQENLEILKYEFEETIISLDSLIKILGEIVKENDIPSLLKSILKTICEYSEMEMGIFVEKDDNNDYQLACAHNFDSQITFKIIEKKEDSLVWSIDDIGTSIIVKDIQNDSRYDPNELFENTQKWSCIGKKINLENKFEGIFLLYNPLLETIHLKGRLEKLERLSSVFLPHLDIKLKNIKSTIELSNSHDYLNNIISSMNDILFVIKRDGQIKTVNNSVSNILGYSAKELMGRNFLQLSEDIDISHLDEEKLLQLKEIFVRSKDNQKIPVSLSGSILAKTSQGEIDEILLVLRDDRERKKAEEKIRSSLKEKEVLIQEIHHRVKNNMQIVGSMLKTQARRIDDKLYKDKFVESQMRVSAMAMIHQKLYESNTLSEIDFGVYIKSLAKGLVRVYGVTNCRLNIKSEEALFNIETAIPCGLIVNELLTNSFKYAFKEISEKEITITLSLINDQEYELLVGDNGIGFPEGLDFRESTSMGLNIVNLLVNDQLEGEITLDRSSGTKYRIKFKKLIYKPR